MTGGPPTVATVIPCRNEARTIGRLLDALAEQTRQPDQIIVVDDASSDGTVAAVDGWARAHQHVRVAVVAARGRGTGAAMNTGITAADADIIVRLDGHSRPGAEYVERSVETLIDHGAGIAGGVWMLEPGAPTPVARGIVAALAHPLGSGGADYRHPSSAAGAVKPVDTVPFGAFRRDLWQALGGFDEWLVRNQDYDFNYRARLSGQRVMLNPAIVSVYQARPTLRALARQYFQYGYWKVQTLRKHPASLRLRQFLPLLLLPVLAGLVAATLMTRAIGPAIVLALYPALVVAGAAHAAHRAGDLRLTPFVFAAIVVLQNAWSAGAAKAFLTARPPRARVAA
jgi:glycosyltransferase involved in cell wall biosynthesis